MTTQLKIETFPNEAAVAYIKGKAVADPKNFGNLPNQLKQRAFAVAGIEQLDAVRRIKDAVAKLPQGASWDEAKKEIAEVMSTYTGGDMKAARARAEHTLRIQGFQAYSVARHQQQMATVDILPYWKYVTVGDTRVRAAHAKLDGKVLRADDDWWKTHYPPWDWGCRCIVESLTERQARKEGISEHNDMPTPERSGTYSFDPTNAGISIDQLAASRDDADMRIISSQASQVTVQANNREPETMWELMVDEKMAKTAKALTAETWRDGKERAIVIDFKTGKQIGKVTVGDERSVGMDADARDRDVATLHTHPTGYTIPSPADILEGFRHNGKAEYIAAGKQLRRWKWLKTPEADDIALLKMYDADNDKDGVNIDAYLDVIDRLVRDGYIKMEELS